MNARYLTLAATIAGLAVLGRTAPLLADPYAVTLSPLSPITFEIGAERAVTYFVTENGQCRVVHTQAPEPDWNDAGFTTARFEAAIEAGTSTRYVSPDGIALDFACGTDARSVSVEGVEPAALADAS